MKYKNYDVYLQYKKYYNGRVCIQLTHAHDHDPVAIATVNLPDDELGEGEVFIKNYSENEGMLEWLEKNGIVERTGRVVPSGYVTIPVCRLLK